MLAWAYAGGFSLDASADGAVRPYVHSTCCEPQSEPDDVEYPRKKRSVPLREREEIQELLSGEGAFNDTCDIEDDHDRHRGRGARRAWVHGDILDRRGRSKRLPARHDLVRSARALSLTPGRRVAARRSYHCRASVMARGSSEGKSERGFRCPSRRSSLDADRRPHRIRCSSFADVQFQSRSLVGHDPSC